MIKENARKDIIHPENSVLTQCSPPLQIMGKQLNEASVKATENKVEC